MEQENKPKKLKEPGQYMAMGIALGAGIGTALGVAFSNIAMGVALGISIGVAIGAGLEQKAKKIGEIRELTAEEQKRKNKYARIAFVAALLIFAVLIILFFTLKII